MTLRDVPIGVECRVQKLNTGDEQLDSFLFSLGCYSGEPVTVVSRKRGGLVVSIKDGRYNLDPELSAAIEVVSDTATDSEAPASSAEGEKKKKRFSLLGAFGGI